MSTRRARIKAVTSLPPRRKNNDNPGKSKSTTVSSNEVEQILKSPKTPREVLKNQEFSEKRSPKITVETSLKSPREHQNNAVNQSDLLKSFSFNNEPTVSPNVLDKGSVVTSTSTVKPLFLSPKSVSSPKAAASTPKTSLSDIDAQRHNTPLKVIESSTQNDNSKPVGVESNEKNTVINTVVPEVPNDVPDDYNVPSVSESVTEDGMDGIVPLQSVASGPKPIAMLKNEIISENAEVLFDPIVPLPSPSKVRPKLRPVPRLNPIRRNSVQGSASESEDESRRALLNPSSTPVPSRQRTVSHTSISTMHSLPNRDVTRVRNDSVCSSASQVTGVPAAAASPLRERCVTKSRRQDSSRRTAAMRRRRETAKSGALTMYDLIFYNPTSNPIIPDEDEINAKEANEKVESLKNTAPEPEENPDDPPASDPAPVPQIKLGPNGEIVLDEQSLVIKQSGTRKVSSSVVVEGSWSGLGSGRYKRTPRTAEWSNAETVRFYRALAALGTDFTLMERLFPGRTRRDLKLKFKKEERLNMAQIDKALRTSSKWDPNKLEEEFTAEREAAERREKAESERLKQSAIEARDRTKLAKELRMRRSKAVRAMETSIMPDMNHGNGLTADNFIQRHLDNKSQQSSNTRKRKPRTTRIITPHLVPIAPVPPSPQFAQLSYVNPNPEEPRPTTTSDLATLRIIDTNKPHEIPTPAVPANIEAGSLVVLTVNDPKSPSKKMLQTYIAHGAGNLTPVALPSMLLNSVVSYMNKGTPKSNISDASSPSSVMSHDSRSTTPGLILPSPAKRQRHSSYTITQL